MIPILDFERRAAVGPVMKSDEFDVAIARKVRELVRTYPIKYNPEELVVDNVTADAVFKAGVEMLADVGLYHTETQRCIKFTTDEIEAFVAEYREDPPSVTFGLGQERHTIVPRMEDDPRPPVLWGCAFGAVPEEWFVPYLQSCAQEPVVRALSIAGGIAGVGSVVPKAGAMSEIYCGLWEVQAQKEALRRAGRPGMHLGLIPTVSTVGATAALLGPGLREPETSQIGIHIIPEQRLDWSRLNLAYLCEQRAISPWTSAVSLLGGLGGGPAGVAICMVANFLGQLAYGHGKFGQYYSNDARDRSSHRQALWTLSACFRATSRNIGLPTGTFCMDLSTVFSREESLCRDITKAVALTVNGGSYNWAAGAGGLEARVQADVMSGVAGMSGSKANQLLQSLSRLLEKMDEAGGTEVSFAERLFPSKYDIHTVAPKAEFVNVVRRAADMLAGAGVPFSGRLKVC